MRERDNFLSFFWRHIVGHPAPEDHYGAKLLPCRSSSLRRFRASELDSAKSNPWILYSFEVLWLMLALLMAFHMSVWLAATLSVGWRSVILSLKPIWRNRNLAISTEVHDSTGFHMILLTEFCAAFSGHCDYLRKDVGTQKDVSTFAQLHEIPGQTRACGWERPARALGQN